MVHAMSQLHAARFSEKKQNKLLRHEARLLRRENYIRRTRHVAFWLAILMFGIFFVHPMLDICTMEQAMDMMVLPACLMLCVYTTTLQIRHIDSIKYHQSR